MGVEGQGEGEGEVGGEHRVRLRVRVRSDVEGDPPTHTRIHRHPEFYLALNSTGQRSPALAIVRSTPGHGMKEDGGEALADTVGDTPEVVIHITLEVFWRMAKVICCRYFQCTKTRTHLFTLSPSV